VDWVKEQDCFLGLVRDDVRPSLPAALRITAIEIEKSM
jgi:hypothetical protein